MPTDYGFWPDDHQGAQRVRRQAIQPGKYQPIDVAEGRPLGGLPPQDIELMAQHQDFCFERGSRSEESDQPAPDQPAEVSHRAEDSADSLPRANRIRFATGTPGRKHRQPNLARRKGARRCRRTTPARAPARDQSRDDRR